MDNAFPILLALLLLSGAFAAVLIVVYLRVTKGRRELIAELGGSGRAVPRFKHTLMTAYVISTIAWTVALFLLFFRIT